MPAAVFTTANIKAGTLDVNEATSTKSGSFAANTINIGTATGNQKSAPVTPKAYVNLGDKSALGTALDNNKLLSEMTTINLNKDGKIVALSGGSANLKNSINAAVLNVNGGSILIDATASGSGSDNTINLASGTMTDGTLSITSGSSLAIAFTDHLIKKTANDTVGLEKKFDINAGTIDAKGNITVTGAGSVSVKDGVVLTGGKNGEEATFSFSGDGTKNPTLKTSTTQLDKIDDVTKVHLKNATLELTDDNQIILGTTTPSIKLADSAALNQIHADTDVTIKAKDVLVNGAITPNSIVNVQAENLTLKGSNLKAKSLTAKNVTFGDGAGAYVLQDDLNLSATKEIDDPYKDDDSKIVVADSGNMNYGSSLTVSGTKSLKIKSGFFNSDGNITLSGGTIEVGTGSSGVDAKLVLSSSDTLKLDNGAAGNDITVQGNGDLTFGPDSVAKEKSTGILDISAGELDIVGDDSNKTTITAHNHGALIVNEDQALDLLNMSTNPRTNNGAAVHLSGSGAFVVKGDLTGTDGINVAKIKKGTDAVNDQVVLSGTGNVVSANNAWFTDSGTTGLQLGNGNKLVIAETLTLDAVSGTAAADFNVKNGSLIIGQSLTSNNTAKTIIISNNGTNAASLQLGDYEVETDDYGYDTLAGKQGKLESHSAESGSVGVNLKLSGYNTTETAKLDVVFGKWTAKDIDATKATITVGEADSKVQYPEGATPSLTASKLTLGTDASLTVHAGTDATFDALTMNGDSGSSMDIKGKATINGLEKVTGGNQEAGYNVTKGDITVTGRDASLTLGSKALADLDFAGTTLDANDKYAQNIALDEYAVLKLDLADTVTLNKDKIVALRKEFIKGNTGAALNSGYIHLGAAKIQGLDIENNTIQWSNYKDFSDIQGGTFQDILTDDLTNAKLVVDQANVGDTVQANVGSIGIAANSITLGDTTLHNAAGNSGSFITNSTANGEDKTVGTATVAANATVGLYNGGKLGNVKLTSGTATTDTVLNIVSDKADTNLTSITGAADTVVNVDGKTVVEKDIKNVSKLVVNKDLTVKGNVAVDFLSNDEGKVATIAAKNLTVKGNSSSTAENIEFGGNLVVTNKAEFQDDTVLTGAANVVKTLEFAKGAKIAAGLTVAETLSMKGGNSTELFVGTPATANDAGNNAVLVVNKLDLQGATLTADPSFDKPANVVIAQQLGSATIVPGTGAQAGSLNGTIQTLQNSIVAVGVSVADKDQAIAKAKVFDSLMTANGSLQADKVGAISYVAKTLDLASGAKLRTAHDFLIKNGQAKKADK